MAIIIKNKTIPVPTSAILFFRNRCQASPHNETVLSSSIAVGGVAGTNLTAHNKRLVYYGYSNLVATAGSQEQYQFAAGPYISNHRYLGEGPVYGFQAALDAGIWYEKFHILADWISGNHQKGKLSLGAEVFLAKRLPLSFGWQRSNSDGSQAAVVQITLLAK